MDYSCMDLKHRMLLAQLSNGEVAVPYNNFLDKCVWASQI